MIALYAAVLLTGAALAGWFQHQKAVECERGLTRSQECQKLYSQEACDDVYIPDECKGGD